jgi:hypothetical protein
VIREGAPIPAAQINFFRFEPRHRPTGPDGRGNPGQMTIRGILSTYAEELWPLNARTLLLAPKGFSE